MSKSIVINFVLFQIGWFACVLGAANNKPWLGVLVVLAVVIWHLKQAKSAKPELILLAIALTMGAVFDQLMLSSKLLTYQATGWSAHLVPAWILALWAVFVTALNVSLRWLNNIKSHGKWLIAVLFGAIGGPLAYMGAARLGAVNLNLYPQSYIALGLGWAIMTPILIKLAQKFDGFKT
jgi:hypothetical protein